MHAGTRLLTESIPKLKSTADCLDDANTTKSTDVKNEA
jgi:hypothetical protein